MMFARRLTTRLLVQRSLVALCACLLTLTLVPSAFASPTFRSKPPKPTPPTKVADPVPALSTCASDIFGLSLSYTKSAGLTKDIARSFDIPTSTKGTLNAAINANVTALYGLTSNSGLEALITGSGSANVGDASATLSQGSLCYLQFGSSQALPADQQAALALLKATFPGVPQRLPYAAQTTRNGYVFYVVAAYPVSGSDQTTSQALLLTAFKNKQGKLVLGALSGIGTFSKQVPQQ